SGGDTYAAVCERAAHLGYLVSFNVLVSYFGWYQKQGYFYDADHGGVLLVSKNGRLMMLRCAE
ncbi:hypothetical protein, partial [Pseudomonas syringae]